MFVILGMEKIRRKTKWAFHEWEIGQVKNMQRHELANFRSALSVWNNTPGNVKISYNHEVTLRTAKVTRIS